MLVSHFGTQLLKRFVEFIESIHENVYVFVAFACAMSLAVGRGSCQQELRMATAASGDAKRLSTGSFPHNTERNRSLADERNSRRYPGCGSGPLSSIHVILFADNPQLGAEHGLCRRRVGDVSECGIQMYPGAYVAGGLGAAERSRALESRERQSNSHSHSNSDTNPHASAGRRWLRSGLGGEPDLYGWK